MLGSLVLVAVLLAVTLFSRALLYWAGDRRWGTTLALSTGLLVALPALIGRVTQDLLSATILTALLSAVGIGFLWQRGPQSQPTTRTIRPHAWAGLIAMILLVMVAWAAIGGYWWDEHSGHYGLTAVLSRGIIPPEHPLFPGEIFRYHWGFDLLAAEVRVFTGASVDTAIDVATIFCFIVLLFTALDIGAALAGRHGASLALLLVPLGSATLQIFLFTDSGPMEFRWDLVPIPWAQQQPPPVISNFFQHPQGIGMPISFGVLLLFTGMDQHRRRQILLGALLLGALSLAQITFFSILGLALGLSVLFVLARQKDVRSFAIEIGALLAALGIAFLLGGFLAPGGGQILDVLKLGSYFQDPLGTQLLKFLVLFGIPLMSLPLFGVRLFLRATALRTALFSACLVGFIVPNVMVYVHSWDIVKFWSVAAFFANLLLADLLSPLLRSKNRLSYGLLVPLLVAVTVTGWAWLFRMSIGDGRWGINPMHFPPPSRIAETTGARLEPLMSQRDYVFSTNVDMGISAGLLTPGFSPYALGAGMMIDRKRHSRLNRHKSMARKHLRQEDLRALDTRFLVLSPGDVAALSPAGKKALQDERRFQHLFDVAEQGQQKHVYRISSPNEGRSSN